MTLRRRRRPAVADRAGLGRPRRPSRAPRRLTAADGAARRRSAARSTGRCAGRPAGAARRPRRRRTRATGGDRRPRSGPRSSSRCCARGRTLGALTLALGPSGRALDAGRPGAWPRTWPPGPRSPWTTPGCTSDVQEADRRKDEFLAMLAHELRNPLAPIRNAVEVLRLPAADRPRSRLGPGHDRPPGRRTWPGWSTTCSTCPGSPAARSSCSRSRSTWRGVVAAGRRDEPAARSRPGGTG